jgi:hypothetical protein
VADPRYTPAFLRRVAELEQTASTAELELLDRTLARIVASPYLRERFPTFYDPALPTYFIRTNPYLIEFAVDRETDTVTFVTLFHRS